jgi:cytochrome c oxidase subunit 2
MREFLGLPFDASAQGPLIDRMIILVHWLMIVLFVGWGTYFAYVLIRFRRSRNAQADYHGVRNHASSDLEGIVAVIEAVLLIGFAIPLWSMRVNDAPPESDATVVRIVAEQFAWNVHYPGPDGVFGRTDISLITSENPLGLDRNDPAAKDDIMTINQLNLPVGKPVIIHLSSKDVIHSFNLPLFRVKQDAIPGQSIRVWFTPTATTADVQHSMARKFSVASARVPEDLATLVTLADYTGKDGQVVLAKGSTLTDDVLPALRDAGISEVVVAPETPTEIACAQLCGLGHYRMRGFVTVQTPDEYNAWIADQESQIAQAQ